MSLTRLFVQLGPLAADRNGLIAVELIGRHEPDAACPSWGLYPSTHAQAQEQASSTLLTHAARVVVMVHRHKELSAARRVGVHSRLGVPDDLGLSSGAPGVAGGTTGPLNPC